LRCKAFAFQLSAEVDPGCVPPRGAFGCLCGHLRDLPAIRWKIENLGKLRTRDATRFTHQGALLEEGFAALVDS